jgi:hypothetical protein
MELSSMLNQEATDAFSLLKKLAMLKVAGRWLSR